MLMKLWQKKLSMSFMVKIIICFTLQKIKREIKDIEEWFKNKISHLKFPNKIILVKKFKKTASGKIKI